MTLLLSPLVPPQTPSSTKRIQYAPHTSDTPPTPLSRTHTNGRAVAVTLSPHDCARPRLGHVAMHPCGRAVVQLGHGSVVWACGSATARSCGRVSRPRLVLAVVRHVYGSAVRPCGSATARLCGCTACL
eukprot:185541-Chlamydomonas_euryale.AAC.1